MNESHSHFSGMLCPLPALHTVNRGFSKGKLKQISGEIALGMVQSFSHLLAMQGRRLKKDRKHPLNYLPINLGFVV